MTIEEKATEFTKAIHALIDCGDYHELTVYQILGALEVVKYDLINALPFDPKP